MPIFRHFEELAADISAIMMPFINQPIEAKGKIT